LIEEVDSGGYTQYQEENWIKKKQE
jgi:hypothetical protein